MISHHISTIPGQWTTPVIVQHKKTIPATPPQHPHQAHHETASEKKKGVSNIRETYYTFKHCKAVLHDLFPLSYQSGDGSFPHSSQISPYVPYVSTKKSEINA